MKIDCNKFVCTNYNWGSREKSTAIQIQTQTETHTQTQIENIEHFSNEMFDIKDDSITNNQHL